MALSVHIDGASLAALDALAKTLKARMKYMNECVSASCHAIMGSTLRSIRAATRTASPRRLKVALKRRGDLVFSYTTQGGHRRMCLRDRSGARLVGTDQGRPRFLDLHHAKPADVGVYEFVDAHDSERDVYLIAATSTGAARKHAQAIVARRALKFAGLARRALSVLMVKSNTRAALENVSLRVNRAAYRATRTSETVAETPAGGVYTLSALDNLRYARKAVTGGDAAIDLAVRKAVNKSVGLVSHRFKSVLQPGDLPPVFADIKQRKGAA